MTGDAINIDGITMELQNFPETTTLTQKIKLFQNHHPTQLRTFESLTLQDMHSSCLKLG